MSDYGDGESARLLLPSRNGGDDEAYSEEEDSHSNEATTPGRVSYQEYSKTC